MLRPSKINNSDAMKVDKWNWLELSENDIGDIDNTALEATIHLPSVNKRWRRIHRRSDVTSESTNNDEESEGTTEFGFNAVSTLSISVSRDLLSSPRGRCSHSLTPAGRHSLALCGGAYSAATSTSPRQQDSSHEGPPHARTVFVPLNDLWILNAATATWTEIRPVIKMSPFCDDGITRSPTSSTFASLPEYQPQHRRPDPFDLNGDETADSFWGMSELNPPRRGHMAAYYEDSTQSDMEHATTSSRRSRIPGHHSSPTDHRGPSKRRFLIIFGGVTNSYNLDTTSSSLEIYLNDVWVFHFEHCMWRKLHPSTTGEEFASSASFMSNASSIAPPSPRRHAVCWVDNDYFCILGGDIQGAPDGDALHQSHNRQHHQRQQQGHNDANENGEDNREREFRIPTRQGMYVYKLGPLSQPVSSWCWSLQPTTNRYVFHKRGPNWPTVTLPPRRVSALLNAASVCVGRKLWIHGGVELVEQHQMATNYLYRLDLDTWEWVIVQGLKRSPCARCHHGIAAIGKYILVCGGMGYLSRKDVVVDVEVRLPEDNEDDEHDDHPNDRFMLRSIFDLHILDTETLTWKQEHATNISGDWPKARNAFGMTRLGHNKVVVFGGGVFPDKYFDDTHVLELDLPLSIESTRTSGNPCRDNCDTLLRSDLSSLYESGLLSDLTLYAGVSTSLRTFHVHKAILASRCPFFETMFAGPYAEAHSQEVSLPDADPTAVDIVLRFFYTGNIDTSHVLFFRRETSDSSNVVNPYLVSAVLQLCDKWNIFQLGRIIEDALAAAGNEGLVDPLELVAFAKEHNCRRLTLQSLAYVKQKWPTLRFSESLQHLEPHVVAEIEDFVHSLL